MFKFLEIHFETPICSCHCENLEWSLDVDFEEATFDGIWICCQTCDEELYISSEDFVAFFMFDEEYPGGQLVEDEERPQFTLIRGGKHDD